MLNILNILKWEKLQKETLLRRANREEKNRIETTYEFLSKYRTMSYMR